MTDDPEPNRSETLAALAELERALRRESEELARTRRELESEVESRQRLEQALLDATAGFRAFADGAELPQHADEDLRASEQRYRELVETSNDLIWAVDVEGRWTFVNQAARRIYGYEPEEMIGRPFTDFQTPEQAQRDLRVFDRIKAGEPQYHYETEHLRKDGTPVQLSFNAIVRHDEHDNVVGTTGTASDVTERKRFEERLRYLADHDPLTGLFNRRRFEQELARHSAYVNRYGPAGAVILLDLDSFKDINDTLGHRAGDEVIKSIGALLRDRLRKVDILARLGGDEFAVLISEGSREQAEVVAEQLIDAVRRHAIVVAGRPIRITTSLGVAVVEEDERTGEELLADADVAMYEAKEAGRDRHAVYTRGKGPRAKMEARLTWVDRIRGALERDALVLHGQPVVHLETNQVAQHELLVRIAGNGRLIPPGAFLGAAERFGLIHDIDRWVVGQAIHMIAAESRNGRPLRLEVNLSGHSIGDSGLRSTIERELAATGIDPKSLVLEISESAALASMDDASRFARELASLGCGFALDGFGGGFGSFYYLKHLPLDFIKIDGEFIRSLPRNETDQLVVRAIVDFARGLGVQTIAESVEDQETMKVLAERGVDYAQGFHVGRPQPVTDILASATPAAG